MLEYTVIGYLEDNRNVFYTYVNAPDPDEAIAEGVLNAFDIGISPDSLVIVGAVAGRIDLTSPGKDAGKVAYARDLID